MMALVLFIDRQSSPALCQRTMREAKHRVLGQAKVRFEPHSSFPEPLWKGSRTERVWTSAHLYI